MRARWKRTPRTSLISRTSPRDLLPRHQDGREGATQPGMERGRADGWSLAVLKSLTQHDVTETTRQGAGEGDRTAQWDAPYQCQLATRLPAPYVGDPLMGTLFVRLLTVPVRTTLGLTYRFRIPPPLPLRLVTRGLSAGSSSPPLLNADALVEHGNGSGGLVEGLCAM